MSILLKRYIRSVLKEGSYLEDINLLKKDIEQAIHEFSNNARLSSDQDSQDIKTIENLQIGKNSLGYIRDNPAPKDWNKIPTGDYGLGYNPFAKLRNFDVTVRTQINSLIFLYKRHLKEISSKVSTSVRRKKRDNIKIGIKVLEYVMLVDKYFNKGNLKVIGAGVNRVVVKNKMVKDIVIKIALSKKGREDNRSEISFNQNVSSKYKNLFPKVYESDSKNYTWFMIHQVIPFEDGLEVPEILFSFKNKFRESFKFMNSLGLTPGSKEEKDGIISYFVNQLYFEKKELDLIHQTGVDKQKTMFKQIKNYIVSLITGKDLDVNVDAYKIVDDSFNEKLTDMLSSWIVSNTVSEKQAKIKAENILKHVDINKLREEFGSLYEFIINNGITDGHLSNIGFSKNNRGVWDLVILDAAGV